MSFTSWAYLLFLPVVFAVYWLLPARSVRSLFLLAASFAFYGWMQPRLCLLLAGAALTTWAAGLLLQRLPAHRGSVLALGIAALLGVLGFFKYTRFFAGLLEDSAGWLGAGGALLQAADAAAGNLDAALLAAYHALGLETSGSALLPPLGISFFTFQCIGYLVDVRRGEVQAERNPLNVLLFVSFFPQLVAGPIERAGHLLPQLKRADLRPTLESVAAALPLLLRGLLKKTVLADNLAPLVDRVFGLDAPAAVLLYAGTVAFALQIYGDFSGYTDIARGSARLFGIDLMENFRAPYAALTPADFWRRWHISFSRWIRDYLYIPLGGSRRGGLLRLLLVLLATFGLSGLWHGAAWHFVAWGLYFGVLVWLCRLLGVSAADWRPQATGKAARLMKDTGCRLLTFHLVLAGWLLFRAPGLGWLANALGTLTLFGRAPDISTIAAAATPSAVLAAAESGMTVAAYPELSAALVLLAATAFYALPLAGWLLAQRVRHPLARGALYGLLFCALLLLAKGTEYDFIYFRF